MSGSLGPVRLYDTARRAVVPFEPAPPPAEVRIYVCGITPYDSTHLGHANTYLAYDLLIRPPRGPRPPSADGAQHHRRGRLDPAQGPRARGGLPGAGRSRDGPVPLRHGGPQHPSPEAEPKATEWVPEMVALIEDLTAAGHAYTAEGTTWFDVSTWPSFGRLGGYDDDTMRTLAAERGGTPDDPRQRNPLDFVLWQPSAPDEPSWDSPFGPGRPGWHIECSAMSMGLLGTGIDIHGGGSDLIFPHHECELAQSEAAVRQPFVKYWMHCGMVGYEGAKMSKSLGNLVFVSDLCKESAPAAVRLALMGHHYRDDWEWHDGDIAEGEDLLDALNEAVWQGGASDATGGGTTGGLDPAPYSRRLRDALDDDLDAPRARAVLAEMADAIIAGRLDDSAPVRWPNCARSAGSPWSRNRRRSRSDLAVRHPHGRSAPPGDPRAGPGGAVRVRSHRLRPSPSGTRPLGAHLRRAAPLPGVAGPRRAPRRQRHRH